MTQPSVRPLAICVFRHGDCILVSDEYDHVKGERFFRPLGGGVRFGEHSSEAVVREICEEIGAGVEDLVLLGALENIFTCNGEPGHEVVLVYDGRLSDGTMYQRTCVEGFEEGGIPIKALWKPLSDFRDGAPPLYPEGLLELLEREAG